MVNWSVRAQPPALRRYRAASSRRWRRLATVSVVTLFALLLGTGVVGSICLANAKQDLLRRTDAIVVLGGEHDGREQYGLSLLHEGYAPTLLLSNPYPPGDPVMRRACSRPISGGEVICRRPETLTTSGEAMMTRDLAIQRNWRSVIVVSWRFHLPRARYTFGKCLAWPADAFVMRSVPRDYGRSLADWEFTFTYQYLAFAKASLSSC